jgi:hypothetical protein
MASGNNSPKFVPEAALIALLPAFSGYTYDLQEPRYPYKIPGISSSLVEPPKANNCCTFVEALLVKAWLDVHGDNFSWTSTNHKQMMIMMPGDLFSPVSAVIETGMGVEVPDKNELPAPWTVIQGWRSLDPPNGGHTFLILDVHPATGRILTLESNKAFDMDGPGCRRHGDLDDFPNQHPGSNWHTNDKLWTWQRFLDFYRHMKLAKLNVKDVKWVASGG